MRPPVHERHCSNQAHRPAKNLRPHTGHHHLTSTCWESFILRAVTIIHRIDTCGLRLCHGTAMKEVVVLVDDTLLHEERKRSYLGIAPTCT